MDELKEILAKRVDWKGMLLEDIMDGVIKGKLDELVQKSENTIDDAVVNLVYPLLREEVAKYVEEKLG